MKSDAENVIAHPFGGLIPDTVQGRILQELAADPFSTYSPKVMAELTDCSVLSVSRTMKQLESKGLLSNLSQDRQHPLFAVREGSRTINALIFLALAWQDDLDGSNLMDECIREYAAKTLGMKMERAKARKVGETDSFALPALRKARASINAVNGQRNPN